MKAYGVDICVIEDDAAQRKALVTRLQKQYVVVEAADGAEGLEQIRQTRPRVVICDLMLPSLSGLEVCRHVRSDPARTGTYFILLTGCLDRETKHRGLNIGADDYLTKPYDFEELSARLRNGLRISRLQERLHYAALSDGLTGLWNHAHFRHLLDVEYARTRRYGGAVGLLMIDLDYFKAVNDTYGHEIGNQVLIATARHLTRMLRETDVLARYGGEEFTIICPRTNLDEATRLAERIRQTLPLEVKVPNHPDAIVTASIGVVCSEDASVTSVSDLINSADRALYEAKRRGRNRVARSDQIDAPGTGDGRVPEVDRLTRQIVSLSLQAKELCLQSVWSLVQALEARDRYTARHSRNTMFYARGLADMAGWPQHLATAAMNAAMLHDLGKIGIPDAVLLRSGPLAPNEIAMLRRVPLITCKILEPLRIFETEVLIIRHLRERFDGSGYPSGLVGTSIPIGSRLLAVAEAFDAMTSERSYRAPRSIDEALADIQADANIHFDPHFCNLLLQVVSDQRATVQEMIEQTRAEAEMASASQL